MKKFIKFLVTFTFGAFIGFKFSEYIHNTIDKKENEGTAIQSEDDWIDAFMEDPEMYDSEIN